MIAWKQPPDEMPGTLCLVGQCASGRHWRRKSVVEYINQLPAWFSEPPFRYSTPAMFIPFPVYHDLNEPERDTFKDSIKRLFWFEEMRFGIVFDRLRIPYLAKTCLDLSEEARQRVDSTERLASVNDWVARTVRASGN